MAKTRTDINTIFCIRSGFEIAFLRMIGKYNTNITTIPKIANAVRNTSNKTFISHLHRFYSCCHNTINEYKSQDVRNIITLLQKGKIMSKTNIDEINRNIYDIKNKDEYDFKIKKGLTPEIIEEISTQKNDPDWMRKFRLKALEVYNELELPTWGPDLSELDMNEIATYVRPKSKLNNSWEDVPDDIKNTFDKLGIPEAEKTSLAGVGAQYDSEVVYHSMKEELIKQGVVYTDMETAVREYPDLVKEHFMKCVPVYDHKFVALHGAVWSGGSFVYVPKGVKVDVPLQSYFRLNSPESGQFEHTLIIVDEGASLHFIEGCSAPKYNKVNLHAGCVELYVKDNAYLRYSTIENWSKNMLNLNTKKAIVGKNAKMDWVSRFVWFENFDVVSDEYFEWRKCQNGVYGNFVCWKRAEFG